jgi:integrase
VQGGAEQRFSRKTPEAAYKEALRRQRELDTHGALAHTLSSLQRWMAAECFLICDRLGVVLLDVVREFERTHPHGPNAKTLDQVRVEVVAAKRKSGRSERHLISLDYRLRRLVAGIGDQPITAITTDALQAEIDRHPKWNPRTVHGVVQGWKIGFNFAIRRGWLLKNPADRLELPKIVHGEPEIFTVDEVRRLMAATLFRDRDPLLPACRAYLAIGLFAGLRPESEIAPLEWKHVDLETATIRVKAANAKDRDRRIVEIQPNLAAWLRPIVRRHGRVLTQPIDKLRAAVRNVLGLAEWPHDIMRHTYVSYHFGEFQNEAYTKKQVGHRDDGRIFYNHYMVPVTRAAARQFWATVPPVGLLTSGQRDNDGMKPWRGLGVTTSARIDASRPSEEVVTAI